MLPQSQTEDQWKQLYPGRVFAIRSTPDDVVYLRLGIGKSFFLEIVPTQLSGRLINSLGYDSGSANLLYRLADQASVIIGRGKECVVKIINAFVSRQHLEISLDGNILVVKDLGSVNGTYCHSSNIAFDIDKYLESHPLDKAKDSTLDAIHEAFGPTLDDFLRQYQDKKERK